jgi:rhodanese-related sulfurtransferase
VNAAAALFEAGTARPVDANHQETRDSLGTVPNAVLLTSSSEYQMTELPADGLLVFYCGSTQCTASDNAATRAREAGREVAVMRPGIRGWVDAGKPVAGRVAPAEGEGEGEEAAETGEAAAG